ncbi:MAG TPA: CHAT domain-containing tetratricopeptide repeat protein, partial [Chitinophagaceae bacterium]
SNYLLGNYQAVIDSCKSIFKKLLPIDPNNAGYTKSLMGSCYWELGHYDSAVIMNKESIALREKANNVDGQAHSWLQTGELYQLSGLKKQALEAYASAEKLYKDLNDVSGLAGVYNERGKVYLQDENYKKATEYFEKARGVSSKTTVEALYNLGTAWSVIDVVKAKEYYLACKLKSDSAGNTGYQFDATKMLSELAYRTHNIAGGNSYYEECLNIAQQLNIPVVYARCLSLKANGFYAQTKLDSALFYYNAALQIFDSVSKDEAITQINNIANVQLEMGDFSSSEKMLLKAIHQSTKSFNNIALGSTLQSITFLYGLTGEFAKGITSSDSAISIFERSGNRLRLGHVYVSRGTLLKSMGNYRQSINMFLSADTIYQEELASENRHIAMNNIGVTYYNQDDYKTAMKYFRLADSLLNSNEITQEYLLYKANIAECEFYLKNYDTAEAMFLKLYPLAREKKLNRIASGMALGLGKLFFEKKNLTKALNYFENAKNIAEVSGEKQKIIESLTFIGRIANEEKKTDLAELNFKKATALAGKSGISGGWEPYYELGLLYYNAQKFDSSIYYLRQAVDLLDKTSENLFGGEDARKIFNNDPRKSDLYNKITFAYFNIGNMQEAWSFANRSNVAGLKELSGALSATSSDAEKNEILKKIATLQQTKKTLEASAEKQTGQAQKQILKRIEILEADYTNFLQDAAEKYPDLKPYFDKTNAEEFYNYKGKLPNDVGVILYLVNDKTLMIFTLTNEKLSIDTMTADINAEVNAFIRTVKHPENPSGTGPLITRSETLDEDNPLENVTFKDVSGKLYTTLIEPIRDKIKTKKRLCIIPTGLFSNMPFHCLGEKMPDSSFRFLIEDYEVFYANEMSVFAPTEATDKNKNNLFSFAAFGVPDNKLRFNISEVNAIGKIIGVKDSAIYINNRATERMAKQSLENKRYIHFATHGVLVYSSSYSQSYLKFLPDADSADGNNGQLTIKEIQSLLIQDCDLVILSACETAISQQLVKGWNISPANAFLKRKVKSVIASLWKVDDEATSILMNNFYMNLNKKMDKIDALRQAQKTLSRNPKYAHPFYWGAFVLYGDWR